MSVGEKKKRRFTTGATSAALGIYCAANKEQLEGKPFQFVAGVLRKQFNGEAVSDGAIAAALEAANVTVARRTYTKGGKSKTTRALAAVVARLVESIEKAIGAQPDSLLSAEDREMISRIRGSRAIEE